MITDPDSDAEHVMEFVGGLMSRLEGLQKKAFTCKSYQKTFKVHENIHIPYHSWLCACVCVGCVNCCQFSMCKSIHVFMNYSYCTLFKLPH